MGARVINVAEHALLVQPVEREALGGTAAGARLTERINATAKLGKGDAVVKFEARKRLFLLLQGYEEGCRREEELGEGCRRRVRYYSRRQDNAQQDKTRQDEKGARQDRSKG